jgi:DNA-binding response OmpR family regulator
MHQHASAHARAPHPVRGVPGSDGRESSPRRGPAGVADGTGAVRPRILVIDDDIRLLALTRIALAKEGMTVATAESGAAGLERLASDDFQLVVLDVVMPELSGWEVLRRIRETSDVPVMLLTGRDTDIDKARGLDLGADDYLTKPFSFLEFEARVRALLRRLDGL